MPTYREKGIVLKSRTIRDADRHYTIFTEGRGKIVVLAKGSRRGKSKMAPHMASFGVVDLMIAQGRVIDRLAGASLITRFMGIRESLEKTALTQSMFLTTDTLTRQALPDVRIFSLLQEFLDALDVAGENTDPGRDLLFDAAAIKLLDMLGFGLELDVCVHCREKLVPQGNAMAILRGGVECMRCRDSMSIAVCGETIKVFRFFRNEPLRTIRIFTLQPHIRREVTFVMDLLLTHHLEDRFAALHYLRAVT